MKILILILAFFPGGALPAGSAAPPPSVNKIIRKMELVRKEIRDLTTVVERETLDPATGKTRSAEVYLSYKRPDKLSTAVAGRDARRVIINGEKMWVYSPGLKMAEEYRLDTAKKRLTAIYQNSWGLTSPIKALVRGMNRVVKGREDGKIRIELTPDQEDAPVEKIVVWVDPASWLISRMKIFQAGRPPISLVVESWKVNTGLSDELFDFRPPAGVDIFQPLRPEGENAP
jgi:outer membrane lipoprotein carrier protein